MKDFNYYSNVTLDYPSKRDFYFYNVYKDEKCFGVKLTKSQVVDLFIKEGLNNSQLDFIRLCDKVEKLGYIVHETFFEKQFKEHRQTYKDEQSRLYEEFVQDLFKEFNVENHPKRDIVFVKAWDRGHSSGYHEVYDEFKDLVELIQD